MELDAACVEHFRVPDADLHLLRKSGIPDPEIPVVLHLSRHARAAPEAVVKLRQDGKSWLWITTHFGCDAGIFHVEVDRPHGPPYGNAFRYFKDRPKSEWHKIQLRDDEIVHLSNVRFLSELYGCSADLVSDWFAVHGSFVRVNLDLMARKAGPQKPFGAVNRGDSRALTAGRKPARTSQAGPKRSSAPRRESNASSCNKKGRTKG